MNLSLASAFSPTQPHHCSFSIFALRERSDGDLLFVVSQGVININTPQRRGPLTDKVLPARAAPEGALNQEGRQRRRLI